MRGGGVRGWEGGGLLFWVLTRKGVFLDWEKKTGG